MATRRIPLIPPPLSATPAKGDAERAGGDENRSAAGEHEGTRTAPHGARAYRGKSSGEFARVGAVGSDTNALVAEAEGWIATLTDEDNYRRLLKLAVLRRDAVLLSGLLDALRRR